MAELWSDYTDMLISGMDRQMNTKFKVSLRDLLTDPSRYASQQNIQITVGNIKEEVNRQIDARIAAMGDAAKALEDAAAKADSLTGQISQSINVQARQNRVPVIKPVAVDRDVTREERIYVDSANADVSSLIEKLVSTSTLVADTTTAYKNYRIGEWLFSGQKNYVMRVYLPRNGVVSLEASRGELTTLLDAAADFLKGV
ncbi:MAG: hypothetical protein KGH60_02415 [Candidatus Micrarchaeota archaeon]|nr:hypothetical protein [Candidatus Micrarchaeota archaeon]